MRKCLLFVLNLLIYWGVANAQDTLVVYEPRTKATTFVPPVPVDKGVFSGRTTSSPGTLGNIIHLPAVPPTDNLFFGSRFNQPKAASTFFDVLGYPARTAVSIQGYVNGELLNFGSGILIGENLVLTAAHVVYDNRDRAVRNWFSDSVQVFPAFDRGEVQKKLPNSGVEKFFIFKSFYDQHEWVDIGLLQLKEPIGKEIGWVGLGFEADTSFFRNKVFHKFSYPGTIDYETNPPRVYNGDTLYYNYGHINVFFAGRPDNLEISLGVKGGRGVSGQSGSSFLNTEGENYFSFGVLNWSTDLKHYLITNTIFYQFRNVIENLAKVSPEPLTPDRSKALYPNPFHTKAILEFENKKQEIFSFYLFDAEGRLVQQQENVGGKSLVIYRKGLSSGIYFYRLANFSRVAASGKLVIE